MSLGEFLSQAIPSIISQFFTMVMDLLITAVQVIAWPVNQILITQFPDLSSKLTSVVVTLSDLLRFFPYIFTFLPTSVSVLLTFIIATEIVLLGVFRSTYIVSKVWLIVRTIKFW